MVCLSRAVERGSDGRRAGTRTPAGGPTTRGGTGRGTRGRLLGHPRESRGARCPTAPTPCASRSAVAGRSSGRRRSPRGRRGTEASVPRAPHLDLELLRGSVGLGGDDSFGLGGTNDVSDSLLEVAEGDGVHRNPHVPRVPARTPAPSLRARRAARDEPARR